MPLLIDLLKVRARVAVYKVVGKKGKGFAARMDIAKSSGCDEGYAKSSGCDEGSVTQTIS